MTDPLKTLAEDSEGDSDVGALASLEQELERERDKHREERFMWVVVLLLVVDIFTFGSMETWSAPVTIFVLEVIGLLVYARRCGVEEVQQLIDRILETKPLKVGD